VKPSPHDFQQPRSGQPTLYDDWLSRRAHLAAETQEDEVTRLHVQMLDYLLERYQGSAKVQQPARPAVFHTGGVNERAIVVHHHTDDTGSGVSNAAEATRRVTTVLQRLQAHSVGSNLASDETDDSFGQTRHRVSGKLWDKIRRRIRWGFRPDRLIERALRHSPVLPASALQHLFQRIANRARPDVWATEMLLRCENRGVYDLAARAWRERVLAGCQDDVFQQLEQFFLEHRLGAPKQRRIRMELSDERGMVRSAALRILKRIGTLEDISLLSDLLSLPTQDDEYDNEREELVETMQRLAE